MNTKAILCALGLAFAFHGPAQAADAYPDKPIRLIVPYGTGGGADTLARQIGSGLQKIWGQAIAVDNRAGASGTIGTVAVVRSPADGYTLLLQNSTMVVNAALSGNLGYDPQKDLTPIMMLGVTPNALVVPANSGINDFKQLQAYAKANPGKLSYGSCGVGTPMHLAMELIKQKTQIDALHVGYKGCAPALTDVVGGQIPLAILSANLVAPYVKAGKLKALGVTADKRYSLMPDTPTFDEQGLKGVDIETWYALMAPPKLPPELVKRIYADVQKVLTDPTIKSQLQTLGIDAYEGDGTVLAELIGTDLVKFREIGKQGNIKLE
jgi:tripartite-type tricarboxylate transporter receptor subunit TctC